MLAKRDKKRYELLRFFVDSGCPIELISEAMDRTPAELQRRGYLIGLPMKWFRRNAA